MIKISCYISLEFAFFYSVFVSLVLKNITTLVCPISVPERLPIFVNLEAGTGRKSHAGGQNRKSGTLVKQAKMPTDIANCRIFTNISGI